MSFPRYPKYKASGVEWLGEVPEHWRVLRLGFECETLVPMRDKPIDLDGDIPWIRIEDFNGKFISESKTGQGVNLDTVNSMNLKVLPIGTVLCSCSCSMGATAIVAKPLVTNQTFIGIVPTKSFLSEFIYFLFQSATEHLNSIGTGAIQSYLSRDDFRRLRLPSPHLEEQAQIVAFLDRETTKIDELVAEQRRLIDLLKEKRQSVISYAVTNGLNPDAPMKSSGVEWLGNVPAHWNVVPVAYRYSVQLGKMLDSTKITGNHLRPYLRVFDVQWGGVNTEGLPEMDFDEDDRAKFRLITGDLLVNEGGSYPGRSAIWRGKVDECYYQKALHRMRPLCHEKDTTQFLYYVMSWAATQGVFVAGGNETTIEHLPAEKLRRYRFAFPPKSEQSMIAAFLDSETAQINALTTEVQSAIDLLLERRMALISAAVTGQIEVRHLT